MIAILAEFRPYLTQLSRPLAVGPNYTLPTLIAVAIIAVAGLAAAISLRK
ncbi:MAG TPA: hypothetical protein VGL92_14375 [Acidimicrobiia bacterium]